MHTSRFILLAFLCALIGASLALPTASAAQPTCPNEALRAESNVNPATGRPYSLALPDCRAYELVSSGKEDSGVIGTKTFALSSGDGGSLLWTTATAWPYGQASSGIGDVIKATRESAACAPDSLTCWSQVTLAPQATNAQGLEEPVYSGQAFDLLDTSADLSTALLTATPIEVDKHPTKGLVESGPSGCCQTVVSDIPPGLNTAGQLSVDGSRVFFQTQARLVPEDTHGPINSFTNEPETRELYEWIPAMAEGHPRLVGVNGAGEQKGAFACGAVLAGEAQSSHDVSTNGSRVFFNSPDIQPGSLPTECLLGPAEKREVSDLYLRENGSTTVDLSKPPADAADWGASFVDATPDGSKVFFVSGSALTPDKAHSGPGYLDLYEYDVESGVLRRLSAGAEEADLTPLKGFSSSESAIVSADGSHVYFTALGRLVPGAGLTRAENEKTAPETANLYLYAHGRITFVATVEPAGKHPNRLLYYISGETSPPLDPLQAAVTPSGSDIVFESKSRLTAYDNEGHGELYRYDEPSGTITCVSCSPAGYRAEGLLYLGSTQPAFNDGVPVSPERFHGLSEDGQAVFFASTGQLLPAAVNSAEVEKIVQGIGEIPTTDVYEWRGGVLSLISSGTNPSPDDLLGASPGGSDVFFATADALVGQDGDHALDIYDARVNGGFSGLPAPPPPCTSVFTCRSSVATPPTLLAPASASFSGPGNVAVVQSTPSAAKPATPEPKVTCQAKAKRIENAAKRRQTLKRCAKTKVKGMGGKASGLTTRRGGRS